jgi:hypothetical protein
MPAKWKRPLRHEPQGGHFSCKARRLLLAGGETLHGEHVVDHLEGRPLVVIRITPLRVGEVKDRHSRLGQAQRITHSEVPIKTKVNRFQSRPQVGRGVQFLCGVLGTGFVPVCCAIWWHERERRAVRDDHHRHAGLTPVDDGDIEAAEAVRPRSKR